MSYVLYFWVPMRTFVVLYYISSLHTVSVVYICTYLLVILLSLHYHKRNLCLLYKYVSEWLLFWANWAFISSISWREQVTFNEDDACMYQTNTKTREATNTNYSLFVWPGNGSNPRSPHSRRARWPLYSWCGCFFIFDHKRILKLFLLKHFYIQYQ